MQQLMLKVEIYSNATLNRDRDSFGDLKDILTNNKDSNK
jgi:hypothetical protein